MKTCTLTIKRNKETLLTKSFKTAEEASKYLASCKEVGGAKAYCTKVWADGCDVVMTKSYYESRNRDGAIGQVSFKHDGDKHPFEWTTFSSEDECKKLIADRLPAITGQKKPTAKKYRLYYEDKNGKFVATIAEPAAQTEAKPAKTEAKPAKTPEKKAAKKSAKTNTQYTVIEIMGQKFYLVPVED